MNSHIFLKDPFTRSHKLLRLSVQSDHFIHKGK